MQPAALLQQWYHEIWNSGNAAAMDDLMDKNVVVHGLDPVGTVNGVESFKSFYHNFRESFPVVNITLEQLVSNEEIATAYCTVTCKTPKGREIVFNGLSVCRFSDNKIVEAWNNFDFLKMYQQLGHILVAPIGGEQ